ncbi:aconitate hydratase [Pandoraea sputorum]|uniref:Aconitate hydratase A n=1 Tax=Pandoraea sputorum TaxID=93222 RepID=A0A239SIJ4_9BURK|nr:aconitate hydratase [Pandoraea sputorum]AJC17060.1 aconitate hydratase [Pandoraea sputorum]SNU85079.1 Aconitate hydratase [Pandoraea sputorum]VVD82580.1 aconitate hydratase [Pandoraea sputorum]
MSQFLSAEALARLYAAMADKLAIVRRRLGHPLTLSESVLLGHLTDPLTQPLVPGKSYLALGVDRVMFQDVLGQTGMLQFMQTGRERVAVPASIHCDHLIQARVEGRADLKASVDENYEVYAFLRSAAAKYGLGFWEPGAGIIHQVVLENYAFPGALMIGTDSHTPNAGGLGACAVGVGGADAVEALAGLPWEVLYPKRIAVYLTGTLGGWTAPKDVILRVAGELTVSGGTNAIVEYIGPGARTISATGKATITNMGAELGATTSMFPADARMLDYLRASGRGDLVPVIEANLALLAPDPEVEADPEAFYDRVIRIDLSTLEPHVVGPHSPDRARTVAELASQMKAAGESQTFDAGDVQTDAVSAALIGSCTNSSYEDMSRAADVARQAQVHGLKATVPFMVTPGSEQVRATIERDGQLAALSSMGGTVLANACGPCIGQWRREAAAVASPNTIVTSYNRNFPRRNDGSANTVNLIASPEIVTAWALAGRISFDPQRDTLTGPDGKSFRLTPPAVAPEVPPQGFTRGATHYIAPPEDGRAVTINVDPASERIQVLRPWPAWNGSDPKGMPLLIKTRGKTTTDHISPAGPWLKLRGHLERFSDNLLIGGANAFTGETGSTTDWLTGETGVTPAQAARAYRAAGVPWVIVGDFNYGEGSSREHAALSPRLLGGMAVIARSVARIHETNLKKQGLLALTFVNADDYERVRADDRIDLVGLSDLAPGREVQCVLHHADGTQETVPLKHSYSDVQLAWFRAGSALNVVPKAAQ